MKHSYLEKLTLAGISKEEANKEIDILFEEYKSNLALISEAIEIRVKTRKPLQYILKKAWFMDFELFVDERVLIPRPETELLIEKYIDEISKWNGNKIKVLDIGTGSGIIAIALCRENEKVECTTLDISSDALDVANININTFNLQHRIQTIHCDVFSDDFTSLIKEDLYMGIISNPPYISDENKNLEAEVKHEPETALFGSRANPNGILYYERIIDSSLNLKNLKFIAFEIDPTIVNKLKSILDSRHLTKYKILKDYSNNERFLLILLNP